MSPYHAFSNKPILNIDPNGASDTRYVDENGNSIANTNDGIDKTVVVSNEKRDEFDESMAAAINHGVQDNVPTNERLTRDYGGGLYKFEQSEAFQKFYDSQLGVGEYNRYTGMVKGSGAITPNYSIEGFVIGGIVTKGLFKLGGQLLNTTNSSSKFVVQFGKNEAQLDHAFRHTDALGLERALVKSTVQNHFKSISSQVVQGQPFNQIVEIGGQRIQYTAFKLSNGTFNIGRIHGIN